MPLLNILLKLLFIERKINFLSKNMIRRDYEIGETRFCSLCLRLVAKAVNQPHREPVEKLHSCYVKVGLHCTRVAEVGRLSASAKNAFNSFVGRVFANSRQKMSFFRVIPKSQQKR